MLSNHVKQLRLERYIVDFKYIKMQLYFHIAVEVAPRTDCNNQVLTSKNIILVYDAILSNILYKAQCQHLAMHILSENLEKENLFLIYQ